MAARIGLQRFRGDGLDSVKAGITGELGLPAHQKSGEARSNGSGLSTAASAKSALFEACGCL